MTSLSLLDRKARVILKIRIVKLKTMQYTGWININSDAKVDNPVVCKVQLYAKYSQNTIKLSTVRIFFELYQNLPKNENIGIHYFLYFMYSKSSQSVCIVTSHMGFNFSRVQFTLPDS